jgi:hypothetical protein
MTADAAASGIEGLENLAIQQARVLGSFGVGFGVLMVAPQLAQFLPVGALYFGDQRLDGVGALFDDAIAPAFRAVMFLNRVLALVVYFGEGGDNGVGIARAQQFAEKLVMPL